MKDFTYDGHRHARTLTEAWNANDPNLLLELYAEDCDFKDPFMKESIQGKAAFRQALQRWFDALSDVRFHFVESVETDDKAILLLRMEASHTGDLRVGPGDGIEPMGTRIEMGVTSLLTLDEHGRIVGNRVLFDPHVLMRQLGILPEVVVTLASR